MTSRKLLRDCITQQSPEDWIPTVGAWVIVPSRVPGKAWSALVKRIERTMFYVTVEVTIPIFKHSDHSFPVSVVRPHPRLR
jgi:hypothetical protein